MKKSVKRWLLTIATAPVLALVAYGTPAVAASAGTEIIVQTTSEAVHATAGTGAKVVDRVDGTTTLVSVPNLSQAAAIEYFESLPGVTYAEPNYEYHATAVPNDPCYTTGCTMSLTKQWNIDKVGLTSGWDTTTGRKSVTIGIIDSGVDDSHPDLTGHVTVGPNFSSDAANVDNYGHGTHVAGIAAASTNNGIGVAGVDWSTEILSVKVLNSSGVGTATAIAKGVKYAVDNGARIINMSLGASADSQTLKSIVEYAEVRGALVVAAADNQATNAFSYPGAYDGVVAVGASNPGDALASFSNYGDWVDLLAPGTGIVSTWPVALSGSAEPYAEEDGTSMATPLVSGIAALIWSVHPYMSAQGVANRMFETADAVPGGTSVVVHGRVNAARALTDLPVGYRSVASDGGVFSYGVDFFGSMGGQKLNKPIVSAMTTGSQNGYWLVASDGGVFSFGDATFQGGAADLKLNAPIVSSVAARSGAGYYLVASDGGVFAYGAAQSYGSMGGLHLNKPITAIIGTASGRGYWEIASDGGIFSFGDAAFHGSTGSIALNKPIVGGARTPDGNGYWLVASDGGIFSFGDATFYGSAGSIPLKSPVVSMTPTPTGNGYWLTAADGGIFSYGDAVFMGSEGGKPLNKPIVTGMN